MPQWLVSGFSLAGLLVVVAQQAPGIVWALRPPDDDPFSRNAGSLLVEVLEKTFGIATIALLVVVFSRTTVPHVVTGSMFAGALLVLAAYYALYVLYYRGVTGLPVILGMAAFPPLAFALTAMGQGNWPALATTVVFGCVHIGLTYANFGPGSTGRAVRTASVE